MLVTDARPLANERLDADRRLLEATKDVLPVDILGINRMGRHYSHTQFSLLTLLSAF
jgi:hypothetical protein